MAITNYGELKDVLSRYMFHTRFLTDYDNCTLLFEDAANRRLRVRQMETSISLTTSGGTATVPTDYLLWRTVFVGGNNNPISEMEYVHPAFFNIARAQNASPPIFTIENNNFDTRPIDDTLTYEFHYYAKIPTITGGDNTNTNWLLTAYPDVYLSGVLTEVAALARNLELAMLYKQRRDEQLAEIIQVTSLTTGATSSQMRQDAEYF